MVNVAIIGDVHRHFRAFDVTYLNRSSYDLILFVGDLANWWPHEGVEVARRVARLQKPTLFIPGNHDTVTAFQLLAEVKQIGILTRLFALGQAGRVRALKSQLAGIPYCGYSTHPFIMNGHHFDVVAARPYSMGGPALACRPLLLREYGIGSMEASTDRLRQCVDAAESGQILFLAHNGPHGLGAAQDDIWGCDFKPDGGDFGDEDLQAAVEYALQRDKRVIGVVAGHMHLLTVQGRLRPWIVKREGIPYINAARVPRVFASSDEVLHHHIRFAFDDRSTKVEEILTGVSNQKTGVAKAKNDEF